MKKSALALLAVLSFQTTANANNANTYYTQCYLKNGQEYQLDQCKVIETRTADGFLNSRNIFSNKFGLTVKLRWNGKRFMTWDSHNKFEYEWDYKLNPEIEQGSYVMPGFTLVNVSWD